jgi:copper chaperone NosL
MPPLSSGVRALLAAAALSQGATYFLPLWEIQLWAPQYPEGLNMKIWLSRISGDFEIINGINHYIGMRTIRAEMFPEFKIMPWLVAGMIVIGLLPAVTGRRRWLHVFAGLLCLGGALGMADFYRWGYDYGHNLDPKAAINVPGMSYQPPLLGYKALLNFVAYSGPDVGGWIFIGVGVIAVTLTLGLWWRGRAVPTTP